MIFKSLSLAGVAALVLTGSAWAHHSNAMFDRTAPMEIKGTVVEYHLVNPHSYIYLDVVGEGGQVEEWALETGGNVGRLIRANWSADSMQPGDVVTATVSPLKDGTTGALLETVELPDGTILGTGE